MIKRTLIVLATILAIIFVPYYLGMINFGVLKYLPYWMIGFCYSIWITLLIMLIIVIVKHIIIPVYEYIKYGN